MGQRCLGRNSYEPRSPLKTGKLKKNTGWSASLPLPHPYSVVWEKVMGPWLKDFSQGNLSLCSLCHKHRGRNALDTPGLEQRIHSRSPRAMQWTSLVSGPTYRKGGRFLNVSTWKSLLLLNRKCISSHRLCSLSNMKSAREGAELEVSLCGGNPASALWLSAAMNWRNQWQRGCEKKAGRGGAACWLDFPLKRTLSLSLYVKGQTMVMNSSKLKYYF